MTRRLQWRFVADVEPEEAELSVSFDGRLVTYGFGELDALVPAYAASIHKSQGSGYRGSDFGHDAARPPASSATGGYHQWR